MERLRKSAQAMLEKANAALAADRRINTRRRLQQAEWARDRARRDIAMANAALAICDAVESGNAPALAGLRSMADLQALDNVVTGALRAQGIPYDVSRPFEVPVGILDDLDPEILWPRTEIRFGDVTGAALSEAWRGAGLGQMRPQVHEGRHLLRYSLRVLHTEHAAAVWAGSAHLDSSEKRRIRDQIGTLYRLGKAGIHSPADLLAAVKQAAQAVTGANVVQDAGLGRDDDLERARLQMAGIPGFFATPGPVLDILMRYAAVGPGDLVLEPGAGTGAIVDRLLEAGARVEAYEIAEPLREYLSRRYEGKENFELIGRDFLAATPDPIYDRVVMNPPFENRQDADHVRHAYQFLAPGGVLVSVVSAGLVESGDSRAVAFRQWLEREGGIVAEILPAGAFADSGTNVRAAIVVLQRDGIPVPTGKYDVVDDKARVLPLHPGDLDVREAWFYSCDVQDFQRFLRCVTYARRRGLVLAGGRRSERRTGGRPRKQEGESEPLIQSRVELQYQDLVEPPANVDAGLPLTEKILALMSDGRPRTVIGLETALGVTRDALNTALTGLRRRNAIHAATRVVVLFDEEPVRRAMALYALGPASDPVSAIEGLQAILQTQNGEKSP